MHFLKRKSILFRQFNSVLISSFSLFCHHHHPSLTALSPRYLTIVPSRIRIFCIAPATDLYQITPESDILKSPMTMIKTMMMTMTIMMMMMMTMTMTMLMMMMMMVILSITKHHHWSHWDFGKSWKRINLYFFPYFSS